MTDNDIKRLRDLAQAARNVFGQSMAADAIDSLLAERERLTTKCAEQSAWIEDAVRRCAVRRCSLRDRDLSDVRTERDALRADAERYRWLRDTPIWPNSILPRIIDLWDAAIDAARKDQA